MVNTVKKVTFFIKNFDEHPIRFNWDMNGNDCITMTPSVGHINSNGTKTIHATLKSEAKISLNRVKLICATQEIKQKDEKWTEWDNNRKKRKLITPTEFNWIQACIEAEEKMKRDEAEILKKGKKLPKRPDNYLPAKPTIDPEEKKDIEFEEVIPEPEHTAIGAEKKVELLANAKVDYVRYECETKSINFKSTMMYSSRVFEFKVKNTSIIQMTYKWEIVGRNGNVDPAYYKISPEQGAIAPNSEENFVIRFSPLEVEENSLRYLN